MAGGEQLDDFELVRGEGVCWAGGFHCLCTHFVYCGLVGGE